MSKLLFVLTIILSLALAAVAVHSTMKYQALSQEFAAHVAEGMEVLTPTVTELDDQAYCELVLDGVHMYDNVRRDDLCRTSQGFVNTSDEYTRMEGLRFKRKCEQLFDGNYTIRPDSIGIQAHYCLIESGFMYMGAVQ